MTRYQIQVDLEVESGLTANGVESQLETALEPFDDDLDIHVEEVNEE